jgi:hypothetical protein
VRGKVDYPLKLRGDVDFFTFICHFNGLHLFHIELIGPIAMMHTIAWTTS